MCRWRRAKSSRSDLDCHDALFLTIDLRFCICRKFDGWLKAKDPSFGVRNLEDVIAEAAKHGMELEDTLEMPANNLSVILRKTKD